MLPYPMMNNCRLPLSGTLSKRSTTTTTIFCCLSLSFCVTVSSLPRSLSASSHAHTAKCFIITFWMTNRRREIDEWTKQRDNKKSRITTQITIISIYCLQPLSRLLKFTFDRIADKTTTYMISVPEEDLNRSVFSCIPLMHPVTFLFLRVLWLWQ